MRYLGLLAAVFAVGCARPPAATYLAPSADHLIGELRVDPPGYLSADLLQPAYTVVVAFRGELPPLLLQADSLASQLRAADASSLSVRVPAALIGRRVSWVSQPACVRRILTSRISDGRQVRDYQVQCERLRPTGSVVRSTPGQLVAIVASTCLPATGRLGTVASMRDPAELERLFAEHRDCTLERRQHFVR